ncbi:MAG: hypothetical protein R3276_00690, partial [Marinobacter sp.]|nr:hypothetical protein [Marinobacter sp.]
PAFAVQKVALAHTGREDHEKICGFVLPEENIPFVKYSAALNQAVQFATYPAFLAQGRQAIGTCPAYLTITVVNVSTGGLVHGHNSRPVSD